MQVFQSWYVMGRLGGFNSSNLQVHFFLYVRASLFLLPGTCIETISF